MAMEAIFQKTKATGHIPEDATVNRVTYKLRNVSFPRMLTLDRDHDTKIQLSLQACSSTRESWHEFTISTINRDGSGRSDEHSYGLVSIGEHPRPGQSFCYPGISHYDLCTLLNSKLQMLLGRTLSP